MNKIKTNGLRNTLRPHLTSQTAWKLCVFFFCFFFTWLAWPGQAHHILQFDLCTKSGFKTDKNAQKTELKDYFSYFVLSLCVYNSFIVYFLFLFVSFGRFISFLFMSFFFSTRISSLCPMDLVVCWLHVYACVHFSIFFSLLLKLAAICE